MVFNTMGNILKIMGCLMLFPLFVCLGYKESVLPFVYTILIFIGLGFIISPKSPKDRTMYAKEGIVIVSLSWLVVSLIGCLPYIFSGEIPYFVDALFEMVSGITTTGSTVVNNVEIMSKGILFWRTYTHFIGGIGILVVVLAVMPKSEASSLHLLKAESAGPSVGKITSKIKTTALILCAIYSVLTLICFVFLLCGGIGWFDALTTAFSIAGTGGFSNYNNGILHFNSLYIEIISTVFMFLFSINFTIYFLLLTGKLIQVLKSEELRTFTIIVFVSILVISLNIMSKVGGFAEALRESSLTVVSIISTTGITAYNYVLWPSLSQVIILGLMMLGACAGSTAGGYKASRLVSLTKLSFYRTKSIINPRSMSVLKVEGKVQDEKYANSIMIYTILYIIITCVFTLIMCTDISLNFESALSSVITCFNNVGPGLGSLGPVNTFAELNGFSKVILSFLMLLGRLEIFPLLALFSPSTWKRRYA